MPDNKPLLWSLEFPQEVQGMRFVRTCAMNTDTFRQDSDLDCDQPTLQFFFVRPVLKFTVYALKGEEFVHGEMQATAEFRD